MLQEEGRTGSGKGKKKEKKPKKENHVEKTALN